MKIDLAEEEVAAIREYFKNRHHTTEITQMDFIGLLSMPFAKSVDEPEAKRSLVAIKQRVQGRTAASICQRFNTEDIPRLTLRNFKHALHELRVLSQFQIDNLAKFLEEDNDGFVSVAHFDEKLRNAVVPHSAAGRTMTAAPGSMLQAQASFGAGSTNKRTQKWDKSRK